MKQSEYFRQLKLRNAEHRKNQVDTAYEIYTTLTEEEHYTMNLTTFCSLIQARMSLSSYQYAYSIVKNMQMEYQVEFSKTHRGKPLGPTGHKHSEETKKKMSISARTRQLGKKRGPYRKTVERMNTTQTCLNLKDVNVSRFSRTCINNISDKIIV